MKQKMSNEEILNEFFTTRSVKAKVVRVEEGLRICRYFIELDIEEKVSRIKALESDLTLRLRSLTLPIIRVDGKSGCVVIEITTNDHPIIISTEEKLLEADLTKLQIPLLVGVDMQGETQIIDLVDCPHLLIGGSTGSGKSILLKTLINSILRKPNVELVLIDPKGNELRAFRDHPQTLAHCVTYEEALVRINQALDYMETRYQLMSHYKVTNLEELRNIPERDNATDPYVVFIIDEFTDLLLQDEKKRLANALTKLVQKSRAAGIHLSAATQNPKREILSGLIRANMPTTIALKTTSPIESRIILGVEGAEQLVGKGDLLLNHQGKTVQLQGTISKTMTSTERPPMKSL